MQYGYPGSKFYFLLKGNADIIVPKWQTVKLSEDDYLEYLMKLKIYGEKEFLRKTLKKNNQYTCSNYVSLKKFILDKINSIKNSSGIHVLNDEYKRFFKYFSLKNKIKEYLKNNKQEKNQQTTNDYHEENNAEMLKNNVQKINKNFSKEKNEVGCSSKELTKFDYNKTDYEMGQSEKDKINKCITNKKSLFTKLDINSILNNKKNCNSTNLDLKNLCQKNLKASKSLFEEKFNYINAYEEKKELNTDRIKTNLTKEILKGSSVVNSIEDQKLEDSKNISLLSIDSYSEKDEDIFLDFCNISMFNKNSLKKIKDSYISALKNQKVTTEEYIYRILPRSLLDNDNTNIPNSFYYSNYYNNEIEYDKNNYKNNNSYRRVIERKEVFSSGKEEEKEFKVLMYYNVKSIKTGDVFGEFALIKNEGKRTATIITKKDCYLGILDKNSYNKTLNEHNNKKLNNHINYFIKGPIFNNFPKIIFFKNVFNLFEFKNIQKGNLITKENEFNEHIIFLKEGIFEVRLKCSLLEINKIIKLLGGKPKNLEKEDDLIYGIINCF